MKKERLINSGRFLLRNKGIVVVILAVLFTVFIDDKSVVNWMGHQSKIESLEAEKAYYLKKINENKRRITELNSSKTSLEKFAREQFMMKRKNEDIFMLLEE